MFFPIFKSERGSVGLLVPRYPGQKLMKEYGVERERKGFMTAAGFGQGEQGGYVLVDHITADRMTCFSKGCDLI